MILLDLQMGIVKRGIIWKVINPFRVMETAEYIIILLFLLFFIIGSVGSYLKKRLSNQSSN